MRRSLVASLLVGCLGISMFAGCGSSKPDPRTQPGFKDTTDPGAVRMETTPPNTPGMPAGAGAAGAKPATK